MKKIWFLLFFSSCLLVSVISCDEFTHHHTKASPPVRPGFNLPDDISGNMISKITFSNDAAFGAALFQISPGQKFLNAYSFGSAGAAKLIVNVPGVLNNGVDNYSLVDYWASQDGKKLFITGWNAAKQTVGLYLLTINSDLTISTKYLQDDSVFKTLNLDFTFSDDGALGILMRPQWFSQRVVMAFNSTSGLIDQATLTSTDGSAFYPLSLEASSSDSTQYTLYELNRDSAVLSVKQAQQGLRFSGSKITLANNLKLVGSGVNSPLKLGSAFYTPRGEGAFSILRKTNRFATSRILGPQNNPPRQLYLVRNTLNSLDATGSFVDASLGYQHSITKISAQKTGGSVLTTGFIEVVCSSSDGAYIQNSYKSLEFYDQTKPLFFMPKSDKELVLAYDPCSYILDQNDPISPLMVQQGVIAASGSLGKEKILMATLQLDFSNAWMNTLYFVDVANNVVKFVDRY